MGFEGSESNAGFGWVNSRRWKGRESIGLIVVIRGCLGKEPDAVNIWVGTRKSVTTLHKGKWATSVPIAVLFPSISLCAYEQGLILLSVRGSDCRPL